MKIRIANESDVTATTKCMLELLRFMTNVGSDPYIEGLANPDEHSVREYAEQFVIGVDSFALLAELEGEIVGCLAAKVDQTSFPPSGIGLVGQIAACWVREDHRCSGIASHLVTEAEERLRSRGVSIVELSFLSANTVAESAWSRMGFTPFRVHSYKQLDTG